MLCLIQYAGIYEYLVMPYFNPIQAPDLHMELSCFVAIWLLNYPVKQHNDNV